MRTGLGVPGSSFLIAGAALDHNARRTTASAWLELSRGLSLAAAFEGVFAQNSRSLGGKGAIRFRW